MPEEIIAAIMMMAAAVESGTSASSGVWDSSSSLAVESGCFEIEVSDWRRTRTGPAPSHAAAERPGRGGARRCANDAPRTDPPAFEHVDNIRCNFCLGMCMCGYVRGMCPHMCGPFWFSPENSPRNRSIENREAVMGGVPVRQSDATIISKTPKH